MKSLSILAILLVAGGASAAVTGSENIIKQRAKDLRDQNNAQQGVPPPARPPAQPAPAYNPSSAPAPSPVAAQSTNPALPKLQSALETVKLGTSVTDQSKSEVTSALLAVAQGRKPSGATSGKLAHEILSALSEKPLESKRLSRVVQNLGVILNAGKAAPAKIDDAIFTLEATFQAGGLARDKASSIAKTAKAVAAETMPGAAQ